MDRLLALQDAFITHQIYLQRYINQVEKDMRFYVKEMERDLRGLVSEYTDTKDAPNALSILKSETKEITKKFNQKVKDATESMIQELALEEYNFYLDQYSPLFMEAGIDLQGDEEDKVLGAIKRGKFNFTNGVVLTLTKFLNRFFSDVRNRTSQQLESGILLDYEESDLRDSLVGVTGQSRITTVRLAALVGTIVSFVSSQARERSFKNLKDSIIGYSWQAVLDSVTTEFCRWADGRTWYYDRDDGTLGFAYTAPAHYRCRSIEVPIFADWRDLGLNESMSDIFTGKPAPRTTYYEWLERQPNSIQKDVLGATRYDAWKKGTPIDKFYTRDGQFLSLAELKAKNVEIAKEFQRYIR